MIAKRTDQIATFIASTDWGDAARGPLASDASNRKYDRLIDPAHGPAVLMDAPPPTEDIRPFIAIAKHLRSLGLSAPRIYAADPDHGFLLLEDLGDALFARVLARDPSQEHQLYKNAVDALITAQNAPAPDGLQTYGPSEMAEAACLALDWYQHQAAGSTNTRETFRDAVRTGLDAVFAAPLVLTQRDYHAENLIWLPDRIGPARTGLLDFQDAMLCHPAYDLASLLVDARRDVAGDTRAAMLDHYIAKTGADDVTRGFHTVSAQRNLRILGVFTRLCVRDGKRHYPDMIPRVWRNLMADLAHPDLADLRDVTVAALPEPTPDIVAKIKAAHV